MTTSALETITRAAKRRTVLRDLDLRGAKLDGAKLVGLRGEFLRLGGADLSGADLTASHLMDCDLEGADLTGAKLGGAKLWQCKLHDVRAEGAQLYALRGGSVWMNRAKLTGATFVRSELDHSAFEHAVLDGATFDGARANETSFEGASLVGASLAGCSLRCANFVAADLTRADLTLADLRDADLRGATLDRARFAGANIEGAQFDGVPPDTTNAPPSADPYERLVAYLRSGDTPNVRAIWSWWPAHRPRVGASDAARVSDGEPEARGALFDLLLDEKDGWALFIALNALASATDVPVSRVVDRLAALVGHAPISPPKQPGIAPGKRDVGLAAAMVLGARFTDPASKRALEQGLGAKADVQERCATALAFGAARDGNGAALDELARHAQARVRAGAVAGGIRFLQKVARRDVDADDEIVRRAVDLVVRAKKDPSTVVQRAAKRHHVQLLDLARGRTKRRS